MARNFAPIAIEDLIGKIKAVMGDEGAHPLVDLLGDDLKVQFDLENVGYSAKDFGPKPLMGYHTEANGLTYFGLCAGGDWEFPVFFIVYWDGKKLRGYVPTEGNPWNATTKQAYGNDEEADGKDAHKRWPEKYHDDGAISSDDFQHNPDLIRKDILARILPVGVKAPTKGPTTKGPKAPKGRPPFQAPPRPKAPPKKNDDAFKIKSIQERIESLVYYGDADEGTELFQQTCALAYKLFGVGATGKAEIAAAWAEEMAYESRTWAEQHGGADWQNQLVDAAKVKGHWG